MKKMHSEQDALKALGNLRKRKSDERTLSMIKAKIDEALETFYEDLERNYVCDIYKSKYSIDKKRLLWAPKNCKQFSVKEGTEIVLCEMESDFTEVINVPDSVLAIGDNAFYYCTKLNTIIWRPGIKYIGSNVLCGCQIPVLLIPDGVLEIGEGAFSHNDVLTTVYLPNSLITVGKGVFSDCPILSKIYVSQPKERISGFLPESLHSKIVSIGDTDWKFDIDAIKSNKDQWEERQNTVSYNHYEDTSDRDIWDAMTDGMYGDYPDEGYDGDYEFMGR